MFLSPSAQSTAVSRAVAPSRGPRWVLLWAAAWLAIGCTPHIELYPRLDALARQGRYAEAAKLVEDNKDKYEERNEVLFQLDRGLFLHYAGDYQASNAAFEAAERRMDELFTESISREVGAFIVNDNTLPYRGEDFESVVINLYRALNYIKLGDPEAALVEARKINDKLSYINSKYEDDKKNIYQEDAFARLLSGILYELGGTRDDLNDAFIANRKAAELYREQFAPQYATGAPSVLQANWLTTAAFMGGEELERAQLANRGIPVLAPEQKAEFAQLYFIHFAGRAPIKVESSINAIMPDGHLFRIAFPVYKRRFSVVHGSRVLVDGAAAATLEPGQPLGAIAIQNLENRKGRIAAKAIARATTKYIATRAAEHQARRQGGEVAGFLTFLGGTVFTAASEQADLRSWETLPETVLVGRALVRPGTHHMTAVLTTAAGSEVARRELGSVTVKAGEARFFVYHSNQ